MTHPVIAAVDAGHIAGHAPTEGKPGPSEACKLDRSPWPCPAILEAREQHRRQHLADRGSPPPLLGPAVDTNRRPA